MDEHVHSVAHSETLDAVFAGLRADDNGVYRAGVMRVDLTTTMTKWRRTFVDQSNAMDVVTAIAVSPDDLSVACFASTLAASWSTDSYIFTIRAADGGHESQILNVRNGATNKGEHIVLDQGMIFKSPSEIFLAYL